MFEWLGEKYKDNKMINQSTKIEKAIDELFMKNIKTKDIGGDLTTTQFNKKFLTNLDELGYE